MASNILFKFTGPDITGGSLKKSFETYSEAIRWDQEFEQTASPVRSTSGGASTEAADCGTLNISMVLDKSFVPMLKMLWTAKHIDNFEMRCFRTSGDNGADQIGVTYLRIDLESVVIAKLNIAHSPGDLPTVNLSLNYAKITYTYDQSDNMKGTAAGAIPTSYDLTQNVVS